MIVPSESNAAWALLSVGICHSHCTFGEIVAKALMSYRAALIRRAEMQILSISFYLFFVQNKF